MLRAVITMISGHTAEETPGLFSNPEVKLCRDWDSTAFLGGASRTLLITFIFLILIYFLHIKIKNSSAA